MNQSINTDSKNIKEPQQKYRLGTVSIKILGGLREHRMPVLKFGVPHRQSLLISMSQDFFFSIKDDTCDGVIKGIRNEVYSGTLFRTKLNIFSKSIVLVVV